MGSKASIIGVIYVTFISISTAQANPCTSNAYCIALRTGKLGKSELCKSLSEPESGFCLAVATAAANTSCSVFQQTRDLLNTCLGLKGAYQEESCAHITSSFWKSKNG